MDTMQLWTKKDSLEAVKKIFGKDLNSGEWLTLVGIGRSAGLNPFKREIWAVKYKDKPALIFIGRDGYRISAQRHGHYLSHSVDAIYEKDNYNTRTDSQNSIIVDHKVNGLYRGKLVGAWCSVITKKGKYFVSVKLEEYIKKNTSGQNWKDSTWDKIPETMIKKVAEAQCLRMAFPDTFGGTYSESESQVIEHQDREIEKKAQEIDQKKEKMGKVEVKDVEKKVQKLNQNDEKL